MEKTPAIDILCKVVDNYGDIGVVYRLARALSDLDAGLELRLVVDDLRAFRELCPQIDADAAAQRVRGWTVVSGPEGAALFRERPPRLVVECFACGRPDWFEEILFDPENSAPRLIVNLEYLSAESYAVEMHRLPSLTRSAFVKKAMFMPGFVPGTGGLIVDRHFEEARRRCAEDSGRTAVRERLLGALGVPEGPAGGAPPSRRLWASVFSYERPYGAVVRDLAAVDRTRPILALVAAGRSAEPFLSAWRAAGEPFPAVALPFLPQETWDEVLLASDFSIVRGEESLARAALSGRPFLWHAYRLEDGHQLVKVRALLELMRPFFDSDAFAAVERSLVAFNEPAADDPARTAAEGGIAAFLGGTPGIDVRPGFAAWGENVRSVGNLAESLLTFLRDFG